MQWLPEPEPGTPICLGFDGADHNDWTALKAETIDGLIFTPRYGPDKAPTIWDPAQWGGRTPRDQVHLAVDEVFERYRVERMYCDPPRWETDVDQWALRHGDDCVVAWATYRRKQMYDALERFLADLTEKRITHDGCPITALHLGNARMVASGGLGQYGLAKPSPTQKIDAAISTVLAHEAAADARAAGWTAEEPDRTMFVFR